MKDRKMIVVTGPGGDPERLNKAAEVLRNNGLTVEVLDGTTRPSPRPHLQVSVADEHDALRLLEGAGFSCLVIGVAARAMAPKAEK
jgi:hypothetical protein